jgi:hypothetical protein
LPLSPLSDDAARKTFTDITDGSSDSEDVMRLLHFTNNMPLAVDLIAHLADYEGCANVLARWEIEKTSVLSSGNDRKSNLDTSIRVSLSSPRIASGAKELLSLLSILPDGFSDVELLQSHLPIQDIRSCKAVLLATSLVYVDDKKRLRSLMPIREHIQKFSPPPQFLIRPLQKHFHSLLHQYRNYYGAQLKAIVSDITLNLGNLQQVLHRGLYADDPDIADIILCIINLNSFHRVTGRGTTPLVDNIPAHLSHRSNHRLEVHYVTEGIFSFEICLVSNPEALIAQSISHCKQCNDPVLECKSNILFSFLLLMICQQNSTWPLEIIISITATIHTWPLNYSKGHSNCRDLAEIPTLSAVY